MHEAGKFKKKSLLWTTVKKTQGQEATFDNGFPAGKVPRQHRASAGEERASCVFPLAVFPLFFFPLRQGFSV